MGVRGDECGGDECGGGEVVDAAGDAALLLSVLIQPRLKRLGDRALQILGATLGLLQQSLHGIRDIKILGREATFADEYERGRLALSRTQYLRGTAAALSRDVLETALTLFILVFFALGIVRGEGTCPTTVTSSCSAASATRLLANLAPGGALVLGYNAVALPRQRLVDLLADRPDLVVTGVKTWHCNWHEIMVIRRRTAGPDHTS